MKATKKRKRSISKGLAMLGLNGSQYRTITTNRPSINSPLTSPKKSSGHHKIKRVFGRQGYHYNDTLTSAYIVLKDQAVRRGKKIYFITVTLDDKTNLRLCEADADDSKGTMIRMVARWFRAFGYITDAIVVMEECSNSFVIGENETYRRLHLHIITMLSDNERKVAEKRLLRDKSMQFKLQDTWLDKRPYNSDDEWEEEEFGEMPVDNVDPDNTYWLNTYVEKLANERTGKVTKTVCRHLPVCLRGVDYVTKTIQKPIGRGQNYTFIGLKTRRVRRERLAKLGRELIAK